VHLENIEENDILNFYFGGGDGTVAIVLKITIKRVFLSKNIHFLLPSPKTNVKQESKENRGFPF